MRPWFFIIVFCLLFAGVRSQYFYESLDLYYNLRSSLVEEQKAKIGFRTYSNINFENTIPNILDNFQLLSRFKFTDSNPGLTKNAEFGAGITSFYSGTSKIPEQIKKPPLYIKMYDGSENNYIITPGLHYVKTWLIDSLDSRIQFGLGIRYNIVGNPEMFSKSYPFGYDFSLLFTIKFFTIQFLHAAHTVYNSFTFDISEIAEPLISDKKRVSIPTEFENLSFLTFALGDPYFKVPSEKDKLLYYLYFSMHRLYLSDKEYRSGLSLKNLDYIFGFNLRYKQFIVNPEFTIHPRYASDYVVKGKYYSILLGYLFNKVYIKFGYTHVVFYEQPMNVNSLINDETVYLDKIILSVDYTF